MVWETLKDSLIFIDLDAKTTNDVFETLGGALTEQGYGKESYVQALKDREKDYPTALDVNGFGIAIPHTAVDHVNKEGTCIAILKDTVRFVEMGSDDDPVDVKAVFMLCVKDPSAHMDFLQRLIGILQDNNVLEALKATGSPEEVIEVIKAKEAELDAA